MNEVQIYEGVLGVAQQEGKLIEIFTAPARIEKVFTFAPEHIQAWSEDKKEMFIKKTMMIIAHDEKLKPCFDTDKGKLSIMKALERSCSTGLEIGGKHAYLIPQREYKDAPTEARYSIKASGYFALLAGGDRPIFSDLRWGLVYEKDQCTVDPGTGEVSHQIAITKNRGELLGCWVQIVKKNGQREAIFFPSDKIAQWKKKSKMPGGAWKEWPEEMAEQACIRHACDKYEQARDLLAAAIYDNEDAAPLDERNNTDILDDVLSGDEEAPGEGEGVAGEGQQEENTEKNPDDF